LKDGKIVSGAASALRYRDGIEVETDTIKEERHKGLASAACAALILSCLDEGLYPSWDAANWLSVMLAEKLGYKFDREYFVYVVE
jgi:predicted GNAT family acetyltransferase